MEEKESLTGTYRYNKETGKVEKVSDHASARDLFMNKHKISGNADRRAGYASLESKGKLKQVNDRECYRDLTRR